ncbi:MAG: GNAT family N-acetyltransferase [Tyzzerella sp.]|nr:GNAT family N-acetyltransferase [Tyzzerella sp.]
MEGLRIIPVTNIELVYSVTAVADEIWHDHFVPIIGEEQVDYMLEKFLSPEALVEQINSGYEYFLFSYEYTFAGFAGIHEKDGSLFLSKLYVHKDFRGKGIASHMFQKFIEICKMRNLDKIWLTCNRHNDNTLAIYDHLGFKKVREEVNDIGNGFVMDDYILEYEIEK